MVGSSDRSGGPPDEPTRTEAQAKLFGLEPSTSRERPALLWTDTVGAQRSARIDGRAVLGSAPDVEITVADPAVSRLHAELEMRDDGMWVVDLGSKNGTYVEGVRITAARLDEGMRLRVGGTTLSVRYDRKPSPVELWPVGRFGPLIGHSFKMRELFVRLSRAAESDYTVLVQGETGTGKELVATAIHEASDRVDAPFAVIDFGGVHPNLLEAELFGHAKGAFTGAQQARSGVVEAADGGTVFLDEVGELPLSLQPKLLRLIESRTYCRIGETHRRSVDVRFVAATNRDLRTMVNEGSFREDLYFRLAVLQVTIPPLRDRIEDIPLLLEHFMPEGAAAPSAELVAELCARPWHGNVRELRNFVERALVFGPTDALAAIESRSASAPSPMPEVSLDLPFKETREIWLDHLEQEYIRRLLERHRGNVSAVAAASGLSRPYVHRLIRKHGL